MPPRKKEPKIDPKKEAPKEKAAKKEKSSDKKAPPIDLLLDSAALRLGMVPKSFLAVDRVEECISTGALAPDLMLGGGWPSGRVCICEGPEGTGKSTLMYSTMGQTSNHNIYTIMMDAEGSTTKLRAESAGIRTDWRDAIKSRDARFFRYIDTVPTGEKVFEFMFEIANKMPVLESGITPMIFCVDSFASLLPDARSVDPSSTPNAQMARMFSTGMQLVKNALATRRITLLGTNQMRQKVRVMGKADPWYPVGGEALKHYSDVRVRSKKVIADDITTIKTYQHEEIGWDGTGLDRYEMAEYKTTKNKSFSPYRSCRVRFWFERNGQPGPGLDPVYDTFQYLLMTGQGKLQRKDGEVNLKIRMVDGTKVIVVPWRKFKAYILDPKLSCQETHMRNKCWQQMRSGAAFDMYYRNLANLPQVDREEENEAPIDTETLAQRAAEMEE